MLFRVLIAILISLWFATNASANQFISLCSDIPEKIDQENEEAILTKQSSDLIFFIDASRMDVEDKTAYQAECGVMVVTTNDDGLLKAQTALRLKKRTFDRILKNEISSSDQNPDGLIIYAHGHMTNARKSASRSANVRQIAEFRGVVLNLGWPSSQWTIGYPRTLERRKEFVPPISDLLKEIVNYYGDKKIHLWGHSQGAVLLHEAIEKIVDDDKPFFRNPTHRFDTIALEAPDLELTDELEKQVRRVAQATHALTYYCASNDKALGFPWLFAKKACVYGNNKPITNTFPPNALFVDVTDYLISETEIIRIKKKVAELKRSLWITWLTDKREEIKRQIAAYGKEVASLEKTKDPMLDEDYLHSYFLRGMIKNEYRPFLEGHASIRKDGEPNSDRCALSRDADFEQFYYLNEHARC